MFERIRWLKDRVVIKPIPLESKGGIIAPQTKADPEFGIVKALAPMVAMVEGLNVGDKILFPKYVGIKITIDDEELLVLSAYQIIGIV